ncbi:hypothetical protein BV133_2031 [Blastochloris viridis]|nr:DUF2007 domain-containing protein [Blastochloris viridis]BAR99624.1 hypothetical protein BV133_2031 [Blastochloris viridis]
MEELMRTIDPVLVTAIEALLGEAGIPLLVADQNIATVEGSIGAFPRRILVPSEQLDAARRLVIAAGLGHELTSPR